MLIFMVAVISFFPDSDLCMFNIRFLKFVKSLYDLMDSFGKCEGK